MSKAPQKRIATALQTRSLSSSPEIARALVAAAKLPDSPKSPIFSGSLRSPWDISPRRNTNLIFRRPETEDRVFAPPLRGLGTTAMISEAKPSELSGLSATEATTDIEATDARSSEPKTQLSLDAATQQSWIVGSQIMSFNKGITAERRGAALHSCLFAQLAADGAQPDHTSWCSCLAC